MPRYRSQELMTGGGGRGVIAATSAPSPAHVGQRWFNTATAVTYQYTRDAAGTKFWLDISSGGIGAVASRGVDFVGDTDPHLETSTTGAGLAVGSVYYNREADRYFVCTATTTNANVWAGRYAGSGGVETTYKSGSDFFRVHTFLDSGTFLMEDTTSVDYLVVGGGGGAGDFGGGGGGAGGFRTGASLSTSVGSYAITVGGGGKGEANAVNASFVGGDSIFSTITAAGGGRGGGNVTGPGGNGGSGGGAGRTNPTSHGTGTYDAGTIGSATWQGRDGGEGGSSSPYLGGGGGGAAGIGGNSQGSTTGGNGGLGEDEVMGLNASASYALLTNANAGHLSSGARYFSGGGGGGIADNGTSGTGGLGGGGAGGYGASKYGYDGTPNTGGGGGGGWSSSSGVQGLGGKGGSGIVIIRYQINA